MSWISVGMAVVSAVGTGISVAGQQQAAKGAEYTAQYNADLARQQALHETDVANENARRKTRENARIMGLQNEAIAASGLAPSGTPLAILGESVMTLQRDILDMGYEAAARSTQLQSAATMGISEARNTAGAMRTAALGTRISGEASAAGGFLKAKGYY